MGKIKTAREVRASDINCLENLVVAYNTVFLMSSVFVIAIAGTARELFSDFDRILSPSLLLLIVSSFIILIAGLGYVGVGKKSSSLVSLYTMLLIFIFIMEISAGFGILSFRKEIRSMISSKMKKSMEAYPNEPMTANLVDYVQLDLKCCGVNNFRDWYGVLEPQYITSCKIGDLALPPSCCTSFNTSDVPIVNKSGCLPALNFILHRSALSLTTALIVTCTIQILGAYFSYSLASTLSKYKIQQGGNLANVEHEAGISMTFNEKSQYF